MIESNGLGLKKSQCSLLSGDIAWLILLVVDEGYRYQETTWVLSPFSGSMYLTTVGDLLKKSKACGVIRTL